MPDNQQQFLSDLRSADKNVRFAAWRRADEMSPAVLPQLGRLAASDQPGPAKAAREAIVTMVHAVGRDAAPEKRAAVVKQLLALAGEVYAPAVRTLALRQLSLVAGEGAAPAIAAWLKNPQLREEAVFCLERIPGGAPSKALLAAYREAGDDFKPRILAALGHRRAEEALGVAVEAMRSANKEIAMAGVKAFGRIGGKPAAAPRFPETKELSEWQRIERQDSLLRYADAQAARGDAAEAMRLYRTALDRPEEHWQCAAIIGLAKLGTAEAAAAIFPKLASAQRNVRITAEKAWRGMASPAKA